ncbi:MAG: DUF1329 domain-containing protein [Aromatoleum sp.]|jgi:hypothetical protein|uniref:DUF1329 domain-containing protein n=1 Tax=Aromatoleum sp. TaxID=2307007 RepID=UPI002893EEDD|nr:DUF1329 domain-containing protein [Aromatoleum sp.]MDT3670184.1 DUF1329 domain-containing protein [Aromatoleum sp.]
MHLLKKSLLSVVLAAAGMNGAFAAVSADEAKQLGTTLTPWGAVVAGNADGTIPAYTGGLTTPPPNYDKSKPGWRPDPFAAEKPLFRIDAKNAEQYKDRLTPGTIALMKKYPTFFIDVYKTHRTAAYPQKWLDNSIKNATLCKLSENGLSVDTSNGCGGGALFPIPKTGQEVMWNKLSSYISSGIIKRGTKIEYVKPTGEVVQTADATISFMRPLGDPDYDGKEISYLNRTEYKGPTRVVGQTTLYFDDHSMSRTAYSYVPATRRVRLAPDFAADTPISTMGGAATYDDDMLFSGKLDRYDWKLVGKKEVYLPYNNYKFTYPDPNGGCTVKEYLTPSHPKADCIRWEPHRVWHVQATLKEGARHIYAKRDFFIDEDSLAAGLAENYDQSNQLYRYQLGAAIPMYDVKIPGFTELVNIDLISGVYVVNRTDTGIEPFKFTPAMLTGESTRNHLVR